MRWCEGMDPVEFVVACSGGLHPIVWRNGKFIVHGTALAAEDALIALGGEPAGCIGFVHALREASRYPNVYEYMASHAALEGSNWAGYPPALRGASTTVRAVRASLIAGLAGAGVSPVRSGIPPTKAPSLADMIQGLSTLSSDARVAVTAMLTVSAQRRWAEPTLYEIVGAYVERQAIEALTQSIEAWVHGFATPIVEVHARPHGPTVETKPGTPKRPVVSISLTPMWLPLVWARGVACVDGCFVLDIGSATTNRVQARALRWERHRESFEPVVGDAILHRVDGVWRLWWGTSAYAPARRPVGFRVHGAHDVRQDLGGSRGT